MKCFVTVGTTSFDSLIGELNRDGIRALLSEKLGITQLKIQFGRGKLQPVISSSTMEIAAYDFKPTLVEDMREADLIISHAGAGSIVESLRLNKPLIVVVNDMLMDNHQIELARALEEAGYLLCASTPQQLVEILSDSATQKLAQLTKYPVANSVAFARLVDSEVF